MKIFKNITLSVLLGISTFGSINSAMAVSPVKRIIHAERKDHPRISKAIKDLQDAVDYMQNAPDTFGGHKADAIDSSKKAIEQLKKALEYKAFQEIKK